MHPPLPASESTQAMRKNQLTSLSESLPAIVENKKSADPEKWSPEVYMQHSDRMVQIAKQREDEESDKPSEPKSKAAKGKLIELYKSPEDQFFRLEQNLGCELPVCVSNRRDVKNTSLEISVGNNTTWRLTRSAETLLPAPEHYACWLWFLDRCQAAAEAGETLPPRIVVDPTELFDISGLSKGGTGYRTADEAFRRMSNLIINVGREFFTPKGVKASSFGGSMGTLCSYLSWRPTNIDEREALVESSGKGWIAPGQLLWDCIRSGYLKAVSLEPLRQVDSYVAQRLLVYLSKHCKPGCMFKISAAKLLPRIPMNCSYDETKRRLKLHHKALVAAGFLAREPIYSGRGVDLMIIYERTRQGF